MYHYDPINSIKFLDLEKIEKEKEKPVIKFNGVERLSPKKKKAKITKRELLEIFS